MSILDFGPHTVTCYPEETITDSRGNIVKRPSSVGVTITGCIVSPVASNRDREGDVHNDVRLMAREAPIGPWSRVQFPDGRRFFVTDGPNQFSASEGTKHIAATLREER